MFQPYDGLPTCAGRQPVGSSLTVLPRSTTGTPHYAQGKQAITNTHKIGIYILGSWHVSTVYQYSQHCSFRCNRYPRLLWHWVHSALKTAGQGSSPRWRSDHMCDNLCAFTTLSLCRQQIGYRSAYWPGLQGNRGGEENGRHAGTTSYILIAMPGFCLVQRYTGWGSVGLLCYWTPVFPIAFNEWRTANSRLNRVIGTQ